MEWPPPSGVTDARHGQWQRPAMRGSHERRETCSHVSGLPASAKHFEPKRCEQKLRRITSKCLDQRSYLKSTKVTVELDDGAREDQTC
jgi:hypothetical protein